MWPAFLFIVGAYAILALLATLLGMVVLFRLLGEDDEG